MRERMAVVWRRVKARVARWGRVVRLRARQVARVVLSVVPAIWRSVIRNGLTFGGLWAVWYGAEQIRPGVGFVVAGAACAVLGVFGVPHRSEGA